MPYIKVMIFPDTPDGRYFVVKGLLWRKTNPNLTEEERTNLTTALMNARRAVKAAKKAEDRAGELEAHQHVDAVKRQLGERGPVWWTDGAPDYNRHAVKNTPYAEWYATLHP